ncbi:MAG: hypothetical protein ACJ8LG_20700 [Massilia sp.]
MYLNSYRAGAVVLAMLAASACALAGEPGHQPTGSGDLGVAGRSAHFAEAAAPVAAGSGPTAPAVIVAGAVHSVPDDLLPGLDEAAGAGQLDGTRGRSGVTTEATLAGTVSGNAATQVATGNNVIQSGSFANSSGLPVVIQNSGANVLIQSATVINLELK